MPCYRPMPLLVHNPDRQILVPCGQCIGCKLQRSNEWAVRIMHEASTHDENCVALLTYDDEHLHFTDTKLPTLNKRDVQLFIKRLRKVCDTHGKKIRYYAAGEYGDNFGRPHYHIAIMGCDFRGSDPIRRSDAGNDIYLSTVLSDLWGNGEVTTCALNRQMAAYIARYITKKISGGIKKIHYRGREPEFSLQSTRPAIGRKWVENFYDDIYTADQLSIDGHTAKIPRYYDKVFAKINEERMALVKESRVIRADNRIGKRGFPNLKNREINKTAQINKLKRGYENG